MTTDELTEFEEKEVERRAAKYMETVTQEFSGRLPKGAYKECLRIAREEIVAENNYRRYLHDLSHRSVDAAWEKNR